MNFSEIELPSNRKFGFLFTGILIVAAIYYWQKEIVTLANIFAGFSGFLFIITLIKADVLLPLNKFYNPLCNR